MRLIAIGAAAFVGLVGCKTTLPLPVLASPSPTPAVSASGAPPTATAASTTTPGPTTDVGDMSDDGAKNIVIANYLAKAITTPFASGWDANKVFAGLADGSVKPYVAGEFLGGPGWSAAPQEDKYLGKMSAGSLIIPIPSDSDINGGNIAFASKDGGVTWKQVAWSNSTGPHNYATYYGPGDKFKWSGYKLIKR